MVLKTAAPLFTFRNDDVSSDFPQKSLLKLTDEICSSFKEIIRRDPRHRSELKVFLKNIVIANMYCMYNGAEYELVKEQDSIHSQAFPDIRNQVKGIVMSDELKKIIASTSALDFNIDECEKELDLFINANDSERRKMLVEKQNATNKFIAKNNIEPEYNDLYKVLNKIYKHIYKHRLKYKVAAAAVLLTLCILCPANTALLANSWTTIISIGLILGKITENSDSCFKQVLSLLEQSIKIFQNIIDNEETNEHEISMHAGDIWAKIVSIGLILGKITENSDSSLKQVLSLLEQSIKIFQNIIDSEETNEHEISIDASYSEEEDKNEIPMHEINNIWQEIQKITKDCNYLPGHLECRESNVILPELSSEAPRARVGHL